jgi:hypothetical protein
MSLSQQDHPQVLRVFCSPADYRRLPVASFGKQRLTPSLKNERYLWDHDLIAA